MSPTLGVALVAAGALPALFGFYLLVLSGAALSKPKTSTPRGAPRSRLAVLVPAHDEETLIARCVSSLLAQRYPRELYRVAVIADNCSDATAERAAAAGAEVMVRVAPDSRGKGQALRWAMDRLLVGDPTLDAVVVVDADSVIDADMLRALEAELRNGHEVVQADYELLTDARSPKSEIVAAAFLLFHRVRFTGRARLGLAANLVGNGMLFSRGVLVKHPWDAFTGVEDLEFSLRLRLAGIAPRFAPAARLWGEPPASRAGVARQRARWEGGRFHVVRSWFQPLLRAGLVDAAIDLATPPLALLVMVTVVGAGVATGLALAGVAPSWSLVPWVAATASVSASVVIGLWSAGGPRTLWSALAGAPRYVAWKAVTYARLLRAHDANRWDRTDRLTDVAPGAARVNVAGVPVDVVDMQTALQRLRTAMGGSGLFHVSTVNLDFVVRAQHDTEVRGIFHRTHLNVADGAPVVWLCRLLGAKMAGRVAGADLVPALLAEAAQMDAGVFLLGGEGGVAAAAAAKLEERIPGIRIAGVYEPPRGSIDQMDNDEILARIEAARPGVLLVALGHPKQERWIDLHRERLDVAVAIGVGQVFDLIAGRVNRAPRWMQQTGLEWFYRVTQEPRRLLSRYAVDAMWLVPITVRALGARVAMGVAAALF